MDCNQIICFGLVVYPHITSPVSQRSRYVALSNNYKPLSDWTYVFITRTIPNLLVSPFFSCILMYFLSLVNYIKTWKYRFVEILFPFQFTSATRHLHACQKFVWRGLFQERVSAHQCCRRCMFKSRRGR